MNHKKRAIGVIMVMCGILGLILPFVHGIALIVLGGYYINESKEKQDG